MQTRVRSWLPAVGAIMAICWMMAAMVLSDNENALLQEALKFYQKGIKAAKANKLDEAESWFRKSLDAYSLMAWSYAELGNLQMARNDPRGALELYLKARDTFIEIHSRRVKAAAKDQQNTRDSVEAEKIQHAGHTVSGDTTDVFPASTLNQQMKDAGPDDTRAATPDLAGGEIPAQLYVFIGVARIRLRQFDLAEQDLRTGLALDPRLAALHYNLAVVLLCRKRYPESADEARQAKKLGFVPQPEFVKALEVQGKIKL